MRSNQGGIGARFVLIASTLLYGASLHLAHATYLFPTWGYFGFTFRAPGIREIIVGVSLLVAVAAAMPKKIDRGSRVVLLCLYVAVYVPAVVISLSLDTENRIRVYGPVLAMLAVAFLISSAVSRVPSIEPRANAREPSLGFGLVMLAFWFVCAGVLLVAFWRIMSLVSPGDVYAQRAAGRPSMMILGYVQTYFAYVFSPALIAVGLTRRSFTWCLLGTGGCLIMYMIDAQRTVLLLPAAMVALFVVIRLRTPLLRMTSFPLLVFSGIVTLCTALAAQNSIANVLSSYFTYRTLAFPGLTVPLYYDLFRVDGFTWWSHVRGISSVVPVPASYAMDPKWPGLGYIVAERVHGMESNANANLFAGDGVAAGGAIGVLVIGLLLAIYLSVLDGALRSWNRDFAILIAAPLGIVLMNGQFFTAMLSYGGMLWILLFLAFAPRIAYPRSPGGPEVEVNHDP